MEASEFNNFIRKFKNLWCAGKSAKLNVESFEGQAWVSLHVRLGSLTSPHLHPPYASHARQRRRERRAAARDSEARASNTAEQATVANAEEVLDDATAEEAVVIAAKATEELERTVKDLGFEKNDLKKKVEALQQECEALRYAVAVNDMLKQDFRERVRNKYCYSSNDEESDYESNDETRRMNRDNFILKKIEERRKRCNICDFVGKTEAGLKTHMHKKHKDDG